MPDQPNEIPGASVLGYGFDILGTYSIDSITSQLFVHQTMQAQSYTYPPTGIEYAVPDNIAVIPTTKSGGTAHVFESVQEWQSYLSAKAELSVSGDAGVFSAEVDAAYEKTQDGKTSRYLCLFDADYQNWQLQLEEQSPQWVAPSFLDDPDVSGLPDTFSTENQDAFFAVFRAYGTHYVAEVAVGGSIEYRLGVDKSYSSDETKINANVSLEYNAVFVDTKAEASVDWSSLGKSWVDNRVVSVAATGGDSSILEAISPTYGYNDNTAFQGWREAVEKNPAVVEFHLRPISLLLPSGKRTAVDRAIEAYVNGAVWASARIDWTPGSGPVNNGRHSDYTTSSNILVKGTSLTPSYDPTPPPPFDRGKAWNHWLCPVGGIEIAVLDPETLDQLESGVYYIDDPGNTEEVSDFYAALARDYTTPTFPSGYVLVVAAFGISGHDFPQADFAGWLQSCGAALKDWRNYTNLSPYEGFCSYVLIGKQGLTPGNAVERFAIEDDQPQMSPHVEALKPVYPSS